MEEEHKPWFQFALMAVPAETVAVSWPEERLVPSSLQARVAEVAP
jgi:hypothetical protein